MLTYSHCRVAHTAAPRSSTAPSPSIASRLASRRRRSTGPPATTAAPPMAAPSWPAPRRVHKPVFPLWGPLTRDPTDVYHADGLAQHQGPRRRRGKSERPSQHNLCCIDTPPPQLQPNLNELMSNLNKLRTLPPDFSAKLKMKQWCAQRCAFTVGYQHAHPPASLWQDRHIQEPAGCRRAQRGKVFQPKTARP